MYIKDPLRGHTLGSPLPTVVKWDPHRKNVPEDNGNCFLKKATGVPRVAYSFGSSVNKRKRRVSFRRAGLTEKCVKSDPLTDLLDGDNETALEAAFLFPEPQPEVLRGNTGGSHAERMAVLETAYIGKGIPHLSQRSWKPSSRAFAISLLQLLGDMDPIEDMFEKSDNKTLRGFEFVAKMMDLISERRVNSSTSRPTTCWADYDPVQSYNTQSAIRTRETTLIQEWAALSSSRPSPQHSIDFLGTNRFTEWSLASLFSDIDMHSKDKITWEDLYAYFIGASMNNELYNDQISPIRSYILTSYKTGQGASANSKTRDGTGTAIRSIKKIRYIDDLTRMIFLGHDNICKLVNPTGMRVIQSYPWEIEYGKTLDVDVIPTTQSTHLLATSTSDGCVRLYDVGMLVEYEYD
eukprot:TRINITY_DN6151_c0_g1_i1.p1 TRINITY_DN6151_c0_g1~~TRINITY_DN6151_c0_g1_i1.p1  ORF type:complete len:407 (+),score=35.25 TRINITY_DN6151_c0_g1_i1:50-1270(+)